MTFVVLEGQVLDPIWPVGEGMVRWGRRVGERISKREGVIGLGFGWIERSVSVGSTTTSTISQKMPGLPATGHLQRKDFLNAGPATPCRLVCDGSKC